MTVDEILSRVISSGLGIIFGFIFVELIAWTYKRTKYGKREDFDLHGHIDNEDDEDN